MVKVTMTIQTKTRGTSKHVFKNFGIVIAPEATMI